MASSKKGLVKITDPTILSRGDFFEKTAKGYILACDGMAGSVPAWAAHLGRSRSWVFSRLTDVRYKSVKSILGLELAPVEAPVKEDEGKWFLNDAGETCLMHEGKVLTLKQWAKTQSISYGTLLDRLKNLKWPVEQALQKPAIKGGKLQEIPHGTYSGYVYHGCRCADCCAANTKKVAYYRDKKKSKAV